MRLLGAGSSFWQDGRPVSGKIAGMKFELADRMWETARMRRCQLADCKAACCLHGVWMDLEERRAILNNIELILHFMPLGWHDPSEW